MGNKYMCYWLTNYDMVTIEPIMSMQQSVCAEDTYILVKTSWPLISNDEIVTVTYCIFLVKYNDKFYIVPYSENFNYPIEEYVEEKEDN